MGQEGPSLLLSVIESSTHFFSFSRVLLPDDYPIGDISGALRGSSHRNNIYCMDQRTNLRMFPVVKYDYSNYTVMNMGKKTPEAH